MRNDPTANRRSLVVLGALGLAGCVATANDPPQTFVNLAGAETGPDQAQLGTGTDSSLRMTAPVRINGQGPFDFVVDSGANRTVISRDLAETLGLPAVGQTDVHGVSGVETVETFGVDRLDVDAVTSRRLRAPALARDRLGADGLLGVDVLKDRRVIMDFRRNVLSIGAERSMTDDRSSFDMRRDSASRASQDLGRRVAVPARYRFGQLVIIGADVSGRSVTAFIDTGSQSTVGNKVLRRVVLGAPNAPRPIALSVPVLSVTGQVSEGELAAMPLLKIGGLSITGLATVFADLHVFDVWGLLERPSLLLGMDVIRKFNAIELNYMRREVGFYLPR